MRMHLPDATRLQSGLHAINFNTRFKCYSLISRSEYLGILSFV